MSKKKKDPYEDAQEQGTTLEAFVIYQRVDAFVDAYSPCDESQATNNFTEEKLRDFFKAWPCSLGDPLSIYLDCLKQHGFELRVSVSGDLTIFTTEKRVGSKMLTMSKPAPAIEHEAEE